MPIWSELPINGGDTVEEALICLRCLSVRSLFVFLEGVSSRYPTYRERMQISIVCDEGRFRGGLRMNPCNSLCKTIRNE